MELTRQHWLTRAFLILTLMVAMLFQQSMSFVVHNLQSNSLKLTSFYSASGSINPSSSQQPSSPAASSTQLRLSDTENNANPQTFREAEILGLKLMQNGNYQDAIQGENREMDVLCVIWSVEDPTKGGMGHHITIIDVWPHSCTRCLTVTNSPLLGTHSI